MRLNCPNCNAQYEVPIDVIPAEGRDVQCSSCGITWFQAHPDHAAEPDLELDIPSIQEDWNTAAPIQDAAPDAGVDANVAPPADPAPAEAPQEPQEQSLEHQLADVVRQSLPQDTEQTPADTVAEAPEEAPIDDFEAALDAQLAGGETLFWDTDTEESSEPETRFAPEPEPETEPTPEPEPITSFAAMAEPEPEPEPEDEPEAEQSGYAAEAPEQGFDVSAAATAASARRARRRREVDPAVADVLREEAAHEAEVRRNQDGAIETQQEFGLETEPRSDSEKRAGQARARMARMRGLSATEDPAPEAIAEAEPAESRRNLLPDIEEINSTLRATEDRSAEELPDGRPSAGQRRKGGSRLGFGLGLILIAALMFVYARPDVVTNYAPNTAPVVSGYVSAVDEGRIWLDVQMTKLMLWLDGMASQDTGGEG